MEFEDIKKINTEECGKHLDCSASSGKEAKRTGCSGDGGLVIVEGEIED